MSKEDIRNIIQVVGIQYIIGYFLIINLIGFLAMYIDKKRAIKGKWRIPEKTLFTITLLGGGIRNKFRNEKI